jgi:hypothetical protein
MEGNSANKMATNRAETIHMCYVPAQKTTIVLSIYEKQINSTILCATERVTVL